MVYYNIRQNFVSRYQDAFLIKNVTIGTKEFQVLYLNIESINKKIVKKMSSFAYLEYVLSLLGCWDEKFITQKKIIENLDKLIKVKRPIVNAGIGVIGLEHTVSFIIPKNRHNYEISSHISAQLMLANLSIVESLANLEIHLKAAVNRVPESYLKNQKISNPDVIYLLLHSLNGSRASKHLLNCFMRKHEVSDIAINNMLTVLESKTLNRRNTKKLSVAPSLYFLFLPKCEQRTYVPIIEALLVSYMGYVSVNSNKINEPQKLDKLITALRSMLKTGIKGNFTIAAELLSKGMPK